MAENEVWAIVELMGHVSLAGRVTKPGEYGGLWQIDLPTGDTLATEFFGSQSVYRIRLVSEEIARAYSHRNEIIEYNAPIVTRQEHEAAIERAREGLYEAQRKIQELERRLTAVNALPAPVAGSWADDDDDDDENDDNHEHIVDDDFIAF